MLAALALLAWVLLRPWGDVLAALGVAWPTVGYAVVGLARPGDRRRWLLRALGGVVGVLLAAGLVLGGISAIAAVLSDPAPETPAGLPRLGS